MIFAASLLIFILGTFFGSFTNVLVDRGQKRKSILGRSKCDFCGYKLKWYDNVPIISFLAIGARCRKCGKKLSWQYPIVEIAMGLMFVLMSWKAGLLGVQYLPGYFDPGNQEATSQIRSVDPTGGRDLGVLDGANQSQGPLSAWQILDLSFYLIIGFLFVVIFLWDLKYMIIPDGLVLGGLIITVLYYFYRYYFASCSMFDYNCYIGQNVLGAVIVGGFFYALFHYSKGRWIGGGDVKLGAWLGFLIGWQYSYFFLLIAYVLGAAVALVLLGGQKKKLNSQIPFGPFLLISALIILLWGDNLMGWWKGMMY